MPLASDTRVSGIILAGGKSRRLGRPKQTLRFGDCSLLEHVIAQAEDVCSLDPLIVVLPADHSVPDPRVTRATLVRVQHQGTCSSSLHAGLAAIPVGADALVVLPCDGPDLTAAHIAAAVDVWIDTRPIALTLSFRGEPGHPLVFSTALLPRLADLHGEKAMWRLLDDLGDAVERVEIDAPLPRDVDTWEDYQAVLAEFGAPAV
jgi:molybdenum cofactor cytidylyltransferase